MPVIKAVVIGVETQVYGVVCVAVVKKIESRHDIGTDSRKRIYVLQYFLHPPQDRMNVTVAASRIQNWWRTQSWVNLVANDPGCDVCGCTSVFSGTLCSLCLYEENSGCPRCGDPYEWAGALCGGCQEERAESRRERQCDRDRYRR